MRRTLRILTVLVGLLLALAPAYAAQAAPRATVGGGSAIVIDGRFGCTMTTVGHDRAGRLIGLTAGHCGHFGSKVSLEDNPAAGVVGRFARKSEPGDYAVITLDPNRVSAVRTAGGATIRSVGAFPPAGANVCKAGRTTGFSCGPVLQTSSTDSLSYVCANHGDSGGPIVMGDRVVGMLNGGLILGIPGTPIKGAIGCVNPAIPIYSPLVATKMTAILADLNAQGGVGAGFRPI
ncbi:S1 family peptidase [Gordonia sp. N1V]|uniref:S1 family peptidase n=1 Tax=Gordonia sp. N1V TaxID=3034163 RepID=UPI0023E2BD99|nr:S1 family peptidase [Gordonia sp. N1V]MDF3283640.1 S1 family peptidase [Gordonia sp. N1V]